MVRFEVKRDDRDGGVWLSLAGELDLSTAADLEEELRGAERDGTGLVVLDLRELEFMDSSGLRVIVVADSRARELGRRLAIVQGPEPVARVFQVTGLDSRLEIVEEPSALSDSS